MTTTEKREPTMIVSETFNVELARTVRDFLRDHPQRHEQRKWITGQVQVLAREPELVADMPALIAALEEAYADATCGTAGCFAGWASLFAGYRQRGGGDLVYDPADVPEGGDARHAIHVSMEEAGKLALGLTSEQANALFWFRNTLDDIDAMLDRLIADPDDQLDDVNDEHDAADGND